MTEVATTAASIPIPAAEPVVAAVSTPISAAKPKVLKIVPDAPTVSTKKRKGVVIRDPGEELHDDTSAETQSAKDKGKGILVEDPKPMKKKDQIAMDAEYARKLQEEEESLAQTKDVQAIDVQPKDAPARGIQYIRRYHVYKKKPQSESEARKNMIAYLKNTEGFKMAFFKGKTYDQIRPIFQARFDANIRFLLKSKEEMEKEEEEIIKSINETPLEVVADEDDDVFVEATPIGTKVPVVNYEIVMLNNKPRPKENTKCVSAAGKELIAAKHKLKLLELKLFRDAAAAAHMKTPSIGFMRPFGCPVTILNTLDPLGKFDWKADEGFLVGYSVTSKAFIVFNSRTRIVQETLHINFLENQPNVARSGPKWLFDIDILTQSMNYQPVVAGNQPNHNAGIQGNFDADKVVKEAVSAQQYVLLPLWSTGSKDPQNTDVDVAFDVKENENEVHVSLSSSDKTKKHNENAKREAKRKSPVDLSTGVKDLRDDFKEFSINSTNRVNAASAPVTVVGPNLTNNTNSFNAASPSDNVVNLNFEIGGKSSFVDPYQYPNDPDMPALEDIIYSDDEEDVG
nr:retrovirus-related Pol polyprotein from transposon TNT 1-94 [Tanacetum cinerariifolium]